MYNPNLSPPIFNATEGVQLYVWIMVNQMLFFFSAEF